MIHQIFVSKTIEAPPPISKSAIADLNHFIFDILCIISGCNGLIIEIRKVFNVYESDEHFVDRIEIFPENIHKLIAIKKAHRPSAPSIRDVNNN